MLQNHSPSSFKSRPKFLTADEEVLNSSDATQFHEFAREKMQDDEWIRRADDVPRARLTINDTLKIENEIRKLGHEAEEEANDENEDDDVDRNNTSDADEDDDLGDSHGVSDDHDSDGNESDNEAGFADSDDENDPDGNFEFWTPGKHMPTMQAQRRPGPPRKLSTSSIDSTDERSFVRSRSGMSKPVPFTLRPGTPELPDSTDFVCGTLDEDRPLEAAYASCLEARKTAKHALIPQDIDPSFPASDPEDDDVENDATVRDKIDQEEQIGTSRVEESDEGRSRHQSSPAHSPGIVNTALPPVKRCRSPPPKFRLRSPPPRKLFGHSPRRMTSPAPCRTDESPAPSINDAESTQLPLRTSTPLGLRPGLTHTKSLPRTAALWSRSHRPARPYATEHDKDADIHARGAIDIVKGLEQKRQHREKMYKPRRCQPKKKPQPGQGAERMKELGLLMAGKTSTQTSYMLSL